MANLPIKKKTVFYAVQFNPFILGFYRSAMAGEVSRKAPLWQTGDPKIGKVTPILFGQQDDFLFEKRNIVCNMWHEDLGILLNTINNNGRMAIRSKSLDKTFYSRLKALIELEKYRRTL